jgi:ABC-type multidrug transport system fused ATPase/permease subunit
LNIIFKKSSIIGIDNNQDFLFSLGILVFILLLTSIGFKALLTYTQIRFTQTLQYSLSKRLVERYLGQPYSWFLNQHSADLSKSILSEIGGVIANGISPLIELIGKGTITVTILILLIMVDPKVAFITGCSFGISYLVIFKLTKNYVNKFGKERLKNNQLLFKSVNEAFSALKEIKIGNLEQFYIGRFSDPAKIISKKMALASIIGALPRYAIEAVAFGGIIILILYKMAQSGSFINALPIISLYAFAGYRLMPAIQVIYGSFSKFIFISPSLNRIYNDFENLKISNLNQHQETVSFNKSIKLKNICFSYPNSSKTTLKNINLRIPINTTVGIVGSTGSGKTTTADIILGLLGPEKGTIEIDDKIINKENIKSWQHLIGYVPQHIFLSDDTIAANIALGSDPKEINIKVIEKVAKIANLHEFVTSELPNQYHTMIGERGVRLSGGQRQRIGIARALYHNPKVLILDEATSALDNQTEKAVMDAVNNLSKEITIILIAHRLSTVKKCDIIFLLEKGQLKNEGTFEELIHKDENFRNMVNI